MTAQPIYEYIDGVHTFGFKDAIIITAKAIKAFRYGRPLMLVRAVSPEGNVLNSGEINLMNQDDREGFARHASLLNGMAPDYLLPHLLLVAEFLDSSGSRESSNGASAETASRLPDPLRREIPPASPYPVAAMGGILAAATQLLQHVIQAPAALCAQSVLAAATLACQAHRDVLIDGRQYPLSEYFVTLGDSGERKTASDKRALWPHREWERELVQRYEADVVRYDNDRDAYKKSREDILRKEKSLSARRSALEQLGPPPVGPLKPLLLASEPTYEGLVRLLAEGQPSLGLFSNEGGRLIGGHAMHTDHQLKTAAGLSELWDGQRIDRVRGGDGATVLYGRRLSMHVMAQPGVAQLLLGNALLLEQGLLSRCLVAWPETTAGTRLYKAINLSQERDIKQYNTRMFDLLKREYPLAAGKSNELQPPALTLDAAAKTLWVAFHDHVERQLAPEAPLSVVRPFASKAAEHVLRLAGVITLVEHPDATCIRRNALEAGITLVQFYLDEALRLFGASGTDPELVLAEKLLVWAQHHDRIYLRQVYQYGPSGVRDAKIAKRLVAILEEHGWLTRVDGGGVLDGAHRRDVWEVYHG